MKPEERLLELPAGYAVILADLKDQIREARIRLGWQSIVRWYCCTGE